MQPKERRRTLRRNRANVKSLAKSLLDHIEYLDGLDSEEEDDGAVAVQAQSNPTELAQLQGALVLAQGDKAAATTAHVLACATVDILEMTIMECENEMQGGG